MQNKVLSVNYFIITLPNLFKNAGRLIPLTKNDSSFKPLWHSLKFEMKIARSEHEEVFAHKMDPLH